MSPSSPDLPLSRCSACCFCGALPPTALAGGAASSAAVPCTAVPCTCNQHSWLSGWEESQQCSECRRDGHLYVHVLHHSDAMQPPCEPPGSKASAEPQCRSCTHACMYHSGSFPDREALHLTRTAYVCPALRQLGSRKRRASAAAAVAARPCSWRSPFGWIRMLRWPAVRCVLGNLRPAASCFGFGHLWWRARGAVPSLYRRKLFS